MNTLKISILLLAAITLFSCQKDEDVKPATNPRFSVAYVQNIDASGVEFAANVFEFGSEEILEYGFVFSKTPNPSIETGDLVKQSGKPEVIFKLIADYGMRQGTEYFVAAFVRTNKSLVYSEQIKFISKGSLGFLFDSISAPGEVYFGDTIIVSGRNFSKISSNYRVQMMGTNAQILDQNPTSFKIIIPPVFGFSEKQAEQGLFDFKIDISGKELLVEWPLNFRAAKFTTNTSKEFTWGESISISGSDLMSETVKVRYKNPEGNYFEIPVDFFSSNEIRLKPKAPIEEQSPTLEITVRGKKYLLENAFKLKGSEINPGQEFNIFSSDPFTIFGQNFNPDFTRLNKITSDTPGLNFEILESTSDRITLRVYQTADFFLPRTFALFSNTFGIQSKNYVYITHIDLSLPRLSLSPHIEEFEYVLGSASYGKKGYVLTAKKIVEFDPVAKTTSLVHTFAEEYKINKYSFVVNSPNGKIYIGGHGNTLESENELPFIFELDPMSKQVTQLPPHPSNLVYTVSAYSTEQYLYCDGGWTHEYSVGYTEQPERWRYSILDKKWEKLSTPSITYQGQILTLLSFRYKNRLFRFGFSPENFIPTLFLFDPMAENWEKLAEFENIQNLIACQVPVIGNKAYFESNSGIVELNLDDYSIKRVNPGGGSHNLVNLMAIGDKIYSTSFNRVYEADPAYFKFD